MSYKEELQHVVVSALRVSPEYEPLDYEFRGPELLSLVDADYIDGVDVLTFDIVEDGMSEIVFTQLIPIIPTTFMVMLTNAILVLLVMLLM